MLEKCGCKMCGAHVRIVVLKNSNLLSEGSVLHAIEIRGVEGVFNAAE